MSDGRGVLPGMHEEELEVGEVVDDEFFVAGGKEVAGFLVGAVPASERWRASNGMRRDPPRGEGRRGGGGGGGGGSGGQGVVLSECPGRARENRRKRRSKRDESSCMRRTQFWAWGVGP